MTQFSGHSWDASLLWLHWGSKLDMVHLGHCDKCDSEVDPMKLILTRFRSEKFGHTVPGLLCEKCFFQEHGPKRA